MDTQLSVCTVHICLESVYTWFTRRWHPPTTRTRSGSDHTDTFLHAGTDTSVLLTRHREVLTKMHKTSVFQIAVSLPCKWKTYCNSTINAETTSTMLMFQSKNVLYRQNWWKKKVILNIIIFDDNTFLIIQMLLSY